MSAAVTRQHSIVTRYRELAHTPRPSDTPETGERELLLDGLHLLTEALASQTRMVHAAFEHALLDNPAVAHLADRLKQNGVDVDVVTRKVIEAMSPVKTPSGAVGIARRAFATLDAAFDEGATPLVVLAHDVQDPGNVGALIRTSEAAAATAFVACGATADPFGWKSLRGSMGSALRLRVARASTRHAIGAARRAGVRVVALDQSGRTSLFAADLRPPTAILLGSEGGGLPPELLEDVAERIAIPMARPVESLNVGVAAGLVLYEAFRRRA